MYCIYRRKQQFAGSQVTVPVVSHLRCQAFFLTRAGTSNPHKCCESVLCCSVLVFQRAKASGRRLTTRSVCSSLHFTGRFCSCLLVVKFGQTAVEQRLRVSGGKGWSGRSGKMWEGCEQTWGVERSITTATDHPR